MYFLFYSSLQNEVCSRILTDFWVNYTTSYSVSYSFYSQLQLTHWVIESCCVKRRRHFNENWQLIFWVDFSISVLTDFWLIFTDVLIFWSTCELQWTTFDWDWARTSMNEVNWHSAVHCKNDLIDLDWEVQDDLIEWKLLYTQCYTHKV